MENWPSLLVLTARTGWWLASRISIMAVSIRRSYLSTTMPTMREVAGGGSRLNDAGSGGCLRGGQGQVRLPDGQVGEVFFGKEERFEFDEGSLGCNWFAWG